MFITFVIRRKCEPSVYSVCEKSKELQGSLRDFVDYDSSSSHSSMAGGTYLKLSIAQKPNYYYFIITDFFQSQWMVAIIINFYALNVCWVSSSLKTSSRTHIYNSLLKILKKMISLFYRTRKYLTPAPMLSHYKSERLN